MHRGGGGDGALMAGSRLGQQVMSLESTGTEGQVAPGSANCRRAQDRSLRLGSRAGGGNV